MAKEIETGWGVETEMRDGGSENEAATDEAEGPRDEDTGAF